MYARTLMKPDAKGNAINFNSLEEQEMVGDVFAQAIQSLSEADREMPPVVEILKLLRAGIAVHHSGLLPILKEVVELLFQEGLIKVWFVTKSCLSTCLLRPAEGGLCLSASPSCRCCRR